MTVADVESMANMTQKSTYQKCYKSPNEDVVRSSYMQLLKSRVERRAIENAHVAFQWDYDSTSSESEDDLENNQNVRDDISEDSLNQDQTKGDGDILEKSSEEPASEQITNNGTDSSKCTTTASNDLVKPTSVIDDKPPFVNYGCADLRPDIGMKRTHNVNASPKWVYPGALKRLKHLNLQKECRKPGSARKAVRSVVKVPTFKKPSETSLWQTEYQRCFTPDSSRPNTAKSASTATSKKSVKTSKKKR